MRTVGTKQWRWFDQRCFREKVGVAVYQNCVVIHAPRTLGGMDIQWFDDADRADAFGQLVKTGLEQLRDDVVDYPGRNDNTTIQQVI